MNGLYSAREAGQVLGVTKQRVFGYFKEGKLTPQYINGRAYVSKYEVDTFVRPYARKLNRQAVSVSVQETSQAVVDITRIAGEFFSKALNYASISEASTENPQLQVVG